METAQTRSTEDLLHELQVHQIELEMQNESLRQAQFALEESRDRYVDLYEFAPIGYFTLSRNGLIVAVNLTGATLLREERAILLERRFASYVEPHDRERWQRNFALALQQGGKQSCDLLLRRRDGTLFHGHLLCNATDSIAQQLRITLSDITEQKQAEEQLRIAAIAFETQDGMMITDSEGSILRVNQAFTQRTGYAAAEAIGKTPAMLGAARQGAVLFQQLWQALQEDGHWQGEIWIQHKNDKVYAVWLTFSAVLGPDGTASHYVGIIADLARNKEAEAEIHRMAYFDPLTQLPNRRLLNDRIGQALVSSRRSGQHGALLMLDLDNFKELNDTRGHDVGDEYLIEIAQRIQASVRAGDTVARLGGDEFVVMLEELSEDAQEAVIQADQAAEKIRAAIARSCELVGGEFRGTTSIGITLFLNHADPVSILYKHADMALYKAKHSGRNCLRFYDPAMQVALDEHSALEADLRLAMPHGQLRLHYQPQIDSGGRVIGAEMLLRWASPERGLVPPASFIPLAEETALILPIGQWVLTAACNQIKAWSAAATTAGLRLAVNVSARQFRQPEFVAQLREILQQSGANPNRLEIELTEGMMLHDIGETFEKMRALRELGIGCALDNFGTGHSSLSYLAQLPLDQLKIDLSFVHNLPASPNDAIVVQTIITLARSLGLDVIAGGVETEEQLRFLKDHHCETFQGFLFGRPLPLDEFEAFLRRQAGEDPAQP
ncbi:MAG: EAL domain-containing protein [Gammaproteobacteria bacterium]|nr:EAL domain-containing protein [Gammaproteobacteria bacterium]MBU3990439.1 EAL domain-containing protein [Gammaproteobacteria bacterium]MBU4004642.1 EAL domain-containing protein [Gammaproteobacteria bacterium]MBU4021245.1 EAL domain-containing protein [Gammaproteobacteria bacterium]MBU4096262.1 EAL domain-containing protein [Gammaproteobacteria bacterium]